MDSDFFIITPISWTVIAIVILTPILVVFAGLDAGLEFISENMDTICCILIVLSSVFSIIPTIRNRNLLFFLSGILGTSQLIFYLYNGLDKLMLMPGTGFGLLWTLIVFAAWCIYGVLNAVVTYFTLGIVIFLSKKEDDVLLSLAGGIVGSIGWLVNLFVFAIL